MQENKPVLIVGLGNPGAQYDNTRHNVGFMAIHSLVGDDASWRNEHNAMVAKCKMNGYTVMFALPQTFMNNSGVAVQALMAYYKIPLENLVVIHDDMDIKIGDLREKVGGGSAGHNGIKSVDAAVGPEYWRIRIGIGHPRDTGSPINPADWVLGRFSDEELRVINNVISGIKLF